MTTPPHDQPLEPTSSEPTTQEPAPEQPVEQGAEQSSEQQTPEQAPEQAPDPERGDAVEEDLRHQRTHLGHPPRTDGTAKDKPFAQDASHTVGQRTIPAWIEVDRNALTATVVRNPESEDVDSKLEPRLIVEFYSR